MVNVNFMHQPARVPWLLVKLNSGFLWGRLSTRPIFESVSNKAEPPSRCGGPLQSVEDLKRTKSWSSTSERGFPLLGCLQPGHWAFCLSVLFCFVLLSWDLNGNSGSSWVLGLPALDWSLHHQLFWVSGFGSTDLECQGPYHVVYTYGLLWWRSGKELACQCKRCRRRRFDPWVGKIPWWRKWQPTAGFLPGISHG